MPRTILSTAAILAGLVLALLITAIAGLLLYLQYGDLNTQRPRLESLVSQATGRPFRIAGTHSKSMPIRHWTKSSHS